MSILYNIIQSRRDERECGTAGGYKHITMFVLKIPRTRTHSSPHDSALVFNAR